MWRFGHEKYYSIMLEYGSWAIYQVIILSISNRSLIYPHITTLFHHLITLLFYPLITPLLQPLITSLFFPS